MVNWNRLIAPIAAALLLIHYIIGEAPGRSKITDYNSHFMASLGVTLLLPLMICPKIVGKTVFTMAFYMGVLGPIILTKANVIVKSLQLLVFPLIPNTTNYWHSAITLVYQFICFIAMLKFKSLKRKVKLGPRLKVFLCCIIIILFDSHINITQLLLLIVFYVYKDKFECYDDVHINYKVLTILSYIYIVKILYQIFILKLLAFETLALFLATWYIFGYRNMWRVVAWIMLHIITYYCCCFGNVLDNILLILMQMLLSGGTIGFKRLVIPRYYLYAIPINYISIHVKLLALQYNTAAVIASLLAVDTLVYLRVRRIDFNGFD